MAEHQDIEMVEISIETPETQTDKWTHDNKLVCFPIQSYIHYSLHDKYFSISKTTTICGLEYSTEDIINISSITNLSYVGPKYFMAVVIALGFLLSSFFLTGQLFIATGSGVVDNLLIIHILVFPFSLITCALFVFHLVNEHVKIITTKTSYSLKGLKLDDFTELKSVIF